MDAVTLVTMVSGTKGTVTMRTQIEKTTPAAWLLPPCPRTLHPGDECWLGQLPPMGVSLVIAGHLANSSITFFYLSREWPALLG